MHFELLVEITRPSRFAANPPMLSTARIVSPEVATSDVNMVVKASDLNEKQ